MASVNKAKTDEPVDEVTEDAEKSALCHSSKRRKETSDMEAPCVKINWNQTEADFTINLIDESLKCTQANELDVEFTDHNVTVVFPDGSRWERKFFNEIISNKSKVMLQNKMLTLHCIKKVATDWPVLEFSQSASISTSLSESTLSETPMPSETSAGMEDVCSDIVSEAQNELGKDEEPIYLLKHTKHDWIEKDDLFTVHIYTKETDKDVVKVIFEKSTLTVKFQSSDPKFLQLHENTTSETVFCWRINVKHDIIPSKCRYGVKSHYIEITLVKDEPQKWGALEALQRREPATPSKSEGWIAATKSPKEPVCSTSSNPSPRVAFDEIGNVSLRSSDDVEDNRFVISSDKPSTSRDVFSQKPTCKVPPMNKNDLETDQVVSPGFTGLDNLGNTCFMNSVLQALVNTREFRDFFLDHSRFRCDINTENPLGTGGKLAVAFAVLTKVLWSGKNYSYAPSKLKNLVAMKASQFTGFAQHDAQEFMAFLLDGLHEDLNRVRKKPYTHTVDSDGRLDEEVANEAWEVYKMRNNSFIVDLFQGQYKSKLVCPVCSKVSITFDPFLYLSVPLPKKQKIFCVIFMWKDPYRKPVKYLLRLSKDATIENLKEALYRKTQVNPSDMRVFEAYKGKIHKIFERGSDISTVQSNDLLIVSEVLSDEIAGEPVYEIAVIQRTLMPTQYPTRCSCCRKMCPEGSKLKRCSKCFKAGYCDQNCQKNHWQLHKANCSASPEPVGCPFVISIPESRATFSRLCTLMEAYARYSVDVFQPPIKSESKATLTSRPSSSSLSSMSQSSGSMSSLDSQSSLSSTRTLTPEPEQTQMDNDAETPEGSGSDFSITAQAGSVSSSDSLRSANFSSGPDTSQDEKETFPMPSQACASQGQIDSVTSTSRCETSTLSQSSANAPPTNIVLGMQSGDTERRSPLFFIKPVNQNGLGLQGMDGERLENKGDVTIDLTDKNFLSMDWKNNDKMLSYVLTQSKKLEYDEDESVQTECLDELGNISLDRCLDLFTEPEVLTPEEAWYCPSCKEHREASKQLSIWRLPHTLIVQLKRFSFRNIIWRDKIDKMVEFPVRGLDLSQYYIGTHPAGEPPPIYDLYAVVNHHGGILGGHYTSYVRCADLFDANKNEVDWRLCDDSRVTSIGSEKNVVTRGAYLLFYRRRQVFVSLSKQVYPKMEAQKETLAEIAEKNSKIKEKSQELPEIIDMPTIECDEQETNNSSSTAKPAFSPDNKYSDNESDFVDLHSNDDLGYTDMEAVD